MTCATNKGTVDERESMVCIEDITIHWHDPFEFKRARDIVASVTIDGLSGERYVTREQVERLIVAFDNLLDHGNVNN